MLLPFFTERDTDILHGESTRDPLGLLPIWSTVGHVLIPGLASIVSRIDGIQGILFLYTCLNELPRDSGRKVADVKVLLFLERLWEYHLYQLPDKSPCFGITSLSGADFQLSTQRAGVVGTGLRQYYRGTCVNKGIMAPDLRTLKEPYHSNAKAMLDPQVISWVRSHLKHMEGTDYSISASDAYKVVGKYLQRFTNGNEALWQALERDFIDDVKQKPWLGHLVSKYKDWEAAPVPHLVTSLQEYAGQENNKILEQKCQRILDCEPFAQVLWSAFLVAQEESRNSVVTISERLRDTAPVNLTQVCADFQRINFRSRRLDSLKILAGKLQHKNYSSFLTDFLDDYYGSVCKERGKNPLVYVDGKDILALKPGKTGNDWSKSSDQWENRYFLQTQMGLYVDLMARRKVHHG
jgi:hypothetical protein